jgi:hypothetical protein
VIFNWAWPQNLFSPFPAPYLQLFSGLSPCTACLRSAHCIRHRGFPANHAQPPLALLGPSTLPIRPLRRPTRMHSSLARRRVPCPGPSPIHHHLTATATTAAAPASLRPPSPFIHSSCCSSFLHHPSRIFPLLTLAVRVEPTNSPTSTPRHRSTHHSFLLTAPLCYSTLAFPCLGFSRLPLSTTNLIINQHLRFTIITPTSCDRDSSSPTTIPRPFDERTSGDYSSSSIARRVTCSSF